MFHCLPGGIKCSKSKLLTSLSPSLVVDVLPWLRWKLFQFALEEDHHHSAQHSDDSAGYQPRSDCSEVISLESVSEQGKEKEREREIVGGGLVLIKSADFRRFHEQ